MEKRGISKNFFESPLLGKYYIGDRRVAHKILDIRDIETKIDVYEDRVKTWFLDVAKYLAIKKKVKMDGEEFDTNEAGFVILQIAISYIEGNQQYHEGKSSANKSKEFFVRGMRRIFCRRSVNSKKYLEEFYRQVRCGLFHDSMTRKKVTISGELKNKIRLTRNEIKINPYLFLDSVYNDFVKYIEKLRDKRSKKLRKNFELRWNMS